MLYKCEKNTIRKKLPKSQNNFNTLKGISYGGSSELVARFIC